MVAIFVNPFPYMYDAATEPCTMSVVQVRKKPGYGRFGLARKSAPMVSVGPVLAGEIWAIVAALSTGWVDCETDEFRLPTTPTTVSSPASLVAAFLPTSGLA